jgi:hypothetical protein
LLKGVVVVDSLQRYKELTQQGYVKVPKYKPISEQIEEMFSKAMYSLDDFYSNGSFCSTKNPAEFEAISQLEAKVREVWLRCLDGEASLPEFREALKVWYLRVREYLKMEEKAQLEGLKNVR